MPSLVLPRLEEPLARHQLGDLSEELQSIPWGETDDPSQVVRGLLKGTTGRVGVQDQMWARFVLRLRAALDPIELVEAGPSIAALRRIKDAVEVQRLREVAAAADDAMTQITRDTLSGHSEADVSHRVSRCCCPPAMTPPTSPSWLPGRTRPARITNPASGSSSPATPWCSTSVAPAPITAVTRPGPRSSASRPADFVALYEVLREAQAAACEAVAPGVTAEAVDRAARDVIEEAAMASAFSIAPVTASAWRPTRSRTSSAATASRCRSGTPSASSGIYVAGSGARGSRTSWSAPPPVASG